MRNPLPFIQHLTLMFLPEEEHRADEAAGPRVLREHAACPEAGRAGRPGLSGAGPETDQDQTGPGYEGLDTTSGAGQQEHQQHSGSAEQNPCSGAGWEGLVQELHN